MLNDEMKLFVIFCVFLLGAYVTSKHGPISDKQIEGFENDDGVSSSSMLGGITGESRCPNMLIQKGTTLFLYNTKVAAVPGVNPIRFENLEEYVEFMDWLRGNGIKCPVLFLQHSVSTQGESVYSIRPSPTEQQGGLCPSIATPAQLNSNTRSPSDGLDASTMFSPEQITEITRIIDQSGDNDPYNASNYPGGTMNAVITPADKASLLKIQSSYASGSGGKESVKLDGYPGLAAAASSASTVRVGRLSGHYDNSADNEYTNTHYRNNDNNPSINDPNSFHNQLVTYRNKQNAELEAKANKQKVATPTPNVGP
jgi:hypothetical protein